MNEERNEGTNKQRKEGTKERSYNQLERKLTFLCDDSSETLNVKCLGRK